MTEIATEAALVTTSVTNQNSIDLGDLNEKTWFRLGSLSQSMDEWDKALVAYESALRHNPTSETTLYALGRLLSEREQFGPAIEVFQRLMSVGKYSTERNKEYLAEMAVCWLGMEELGKAGAFIQKSVEIGGDQQDDEKETVTRQDQLLHSISNSHSHQHEQLPPSLWYALGMYHDRLGNEEAALDAFLAFIESERSNQITSSSTELSERSREVYYRLGVNYRLMGKLKEARECFDFVRRQLSFCIRPSVSAQNQVCGPCHVEVILQLALIDEAEGEVKRARVILEKLLIETSSSSSTPALLFRCRNLLPKIRQKLGCLALSDASVFDNDSSALALLLKATEEDPQDALNWYYLGRLYLQLRQPTKAYDAYQQAVYRDGRNAAFWNSIGLLYFNIGQFRDSLDALTRAVHHSPNSPVLWWNLGLLYESCHGLGSEDAREAFEKGFEYSRAKQDLQMNGKFEGKLEEIKGRAAGSESEVTIEEFQRKLFDQTIELDANRFVIRQLAAFPRPQSAASMSRFLTYRGQQQAAAAAQQAMRRGPAPVSGPIATMRMPMSAGAGPGNGMRPPMRPNVYGYPQYR